VSGDSAKLHALINPRDEAGRHAGLSSSYAIEYGTTEAYGHLVPGELIGTGQVPIGVEHSLAGLNPAATYHSRVVVTAEVEPEPERERGVYKQETFFGQDRLFTTQGSAQSASLDGRQWELVSPVDKNGGLVVPLNQYELFENVTRSSTAGDAFT